MGAAAIAAVLRRKEQEVVDDFRAAGAVSPATAQPYDALGLGDSLAIKRLQNRAVIREASPGRWYLDEEVWNAVRRMRRRFAMVLLSIVALLGIGVALGLVQR